MRSLACVAIRLLCYLVCRLQVGADLSDCQLQSRETPDKALHCSGQLLNNLHSHGLVQPLDSSEIAPTSTSGGSPWLTSSQTRRPSKFGWVMGTISNPTP